MAKWGTLTPPGFSTAADWAAAKAKRDAAREAVHRELVEFGEGSAMNGIIRIALTEESYRRVIDRNYEGIKAMQKEYFGNLRNPEHVTSRERLWDFDHVTKVRINHRHRKTEEDREQDELEREANLFLASEYSKHPELTPEQPASWGHGGSHFRSITDRKKAIRAERRRNFAEKLYTFTNKALEKNAWKLIGAIRRNVKTLARSRHPFANYVTQRRDSDWKKALSYRRKNGKVIVGINKTRKGSLNQIFEQGGNILWSFASLYRDRTKTEQRAIFKKFIAKSPTWKRYIKKVSKIGDLKLDMTSGPAQPYLKALRTTMKPLRAKLADEERKRFWYARNKKHVHYPFVSKTLFEMSGLLSVPPRKVLTHLATKGQDEIWHKGLLDMTQKELEAFCREQNRLNKRRRNVKRNSIPNLRPEQLAGIIRRVSWRNR